MGGFRVVVAVLALSGIVCVCAAMSNAHMGEDTRSLSVLTVSRTAARVGTAVLAEQSTANQQRKQRRARRKKNKKNKKQKPKKKKKKKKNNNNNNKQQKNKNKNKKKSNFEKKVEKKLDEKNEKSKGEDSSGEAAEFKYLAFCLSKSVRGKAKTWTDAQLQQLRKKEGVDDAWCSNFEKAHPKQKQKLKESIKQAATAVGRENKKAKKSAKLAARLEAIGESFTAEKKGSPLALAFLEADEEVMTNENTHNPIIKDKTWQWKSRTIPFYYDVSIASNERAKIALAMVGLMAGTLGGTWVRFQAVSNQAPVHKLRFVAWDGCASFKGMHTKGCTCKDCCTPWEQIVLLSTRCPIGSIQHELMHAFGIGHTQARSDRNKFVTINWKSIIGVSKNIYPRYCKKQGNFKIAGPPAYGNSKLYDYSSVMHYSPNGFRVPGRPPVMVPKKGVKGSTGDATKMGQRLRPSANDFADIQQLFKGKPLRQAKKLYKKDAKKVKLPKKWNAATWMKKSGKCGNPRKLMFKKCKGACYSSSTHRCGRKNTLTVFPHPGCSGAKAACCPQKKDLKKK